MGDRAPEKESDNQGVALIEQIWKVGQAPCGLDLPTQKQTDKEMTTVLLSKRPTRSFAFKIVFTLALLPMAILFATASSAVAGATNTYCISGNSTGAGWSIGVATWNPPAGGYVFSSGQCPGVPQGADCAALAQAFVDCINNTLMEGQGSAAIDPNDPCCFTITSWWNQIDLYVGPAGGDPDCEVTAAGCPFNPTIFLVSAVTNVPTLTEWGMIIFCVLLFGWMAWVIVRRRKKVTIRA